MLLALIIFESGIYERRLTLGLHHKVAFLTLSKPGMPLAYFYNTKLIANRQVKYQLQYWPAQFLVERLRHSRLKRLVLSR